MQCLKSVEDREVAKQLNSVVDGSLPVAAPEIIRDDDQYYIASLMPSLKGIQMARLKWVSPFGADSYTRL